MNTFFAILFLAGTAPFAILAFLECQHVARLRRDTKARSRDCIARCVRVVDVPSK